MNDRKKSRGSQIKFDRLMRGLIAVSKDELEDEIRKDQRKKDRSSKPKKPKPKK